MFSFWWKKFRTIIPYLLVYLMFLRAPGRNMRGISKNNSTSSKNILPWPYNYHNISESTTSLGLQRSTLNFFHYKDVIKNLLDSLNIANLKQKINESNTNCLIHIMKAPEQNLLMRCEFYSFQNYLNHQRLPANIF